MREALEKMLAAGRDNALLRFGLGQACLKEGDAAVAATHLRQAIVHDPAYSAAWKLLGRALEQLGQDDAAAAATAWATGLEVARERGDSQSVKEMTVFLRRLDKRRAAPGGG